MTKSNTELLKTKIKKLRKDFSDADINAAMRDTDNLPEGAAAAHQVQITAGVIMTIAQLEARASTWPAGADVSPVSVSFAGDGVSPFSVEMWRTLYKSHTFLVGSTWDLTLTCNATQVPARGSA